MVAQRGHAVPREPAMISGIKSSTPTSVRQFLAEFLELGVDLCGVRDHPQVEDA